MDLGVVIDVAEGVELDLQLGQGEGCWLGGEPAFQGFDGQRPFPPGGEVDGLAAGRRSVI